MYVNKKKKIGSIPILSTTRKNAEKFFDILKENIK